MKERGSGILLHITSLPSPYGIGDLGPGAYRFADFLAKTRQKYWQVLPLNPTDLRTGNSPYSSYSAFAGNVLLISPESLVQFGFLAGEDLSAMPPLQSQRCDFDAAIPPRVKLLHRAYEKIRANKNERMAFEEFCAKHGAWLNDFALFSVIKNHHQGMTWDRWERGLRDREQGALEKVEKDSHAEVEREKFFQYLFFKQWLLLKTYCNERGIRLIGDAPIYVRYDSVDVWTHPELFKLDAEKQLSLVAGVPPDYFSRTGQLWGNPVYQWEAHQKTGYSWWFNRISHNLSFLDILRIDHFRGFVTYWEVPATETTAINGQWVEGPARTLFPALLERFPVDSLIAEDLGIITQDVRDVMNQFGFHGMRIIQFAFDGDPAEHPYLPHNYVTNCIAYTGTHDNNTIRGWFENEATPEAKRTLFRYLGREIQAEEIPEELLRLLMMSIANTVIVPMQDLLGPREEARMNRPSVAAGNWEWRFLPDQICLTHQELLLEMTSIYGRAR